MSYSIVPTPTFERSLKVLAKRYKSMKDDLKNFRQSLQENPLQGSDLGGGLRKVRMAIASKGKGKSGGARVITYIVLTKEQDGTIYLLEIYDKSDASTVDVKIIQKQLIDLGLSSD